MRIGCVGVVIGAAFPLSNWAIGSQTWERLVSQLPDAYKQARTLEGTTLAYLPMPAFVKGQSLNEIRLHELDAGFKDKLVSLVEKFYAKSEIVC